MPLQELGCWCSSVSDALYRKTWEYSAQLGNLGLCYRLTLAQERDKVMGKCIHLMIFSFI